MGQTGIDPATIPVNNCNYSETLDAFTGKCVGSPTLFPLNNYSFGKISCGGGDFDGTGGRVGMGYTCAVGADSIMEVIAGGNIYCWGANTMGQLGVDPGLVPWSYEPQIIDFPYGIDFMDKISTGFGHACADGLGFSLCWGANMVGQLGNNTYDTSISPVIVDVPAYQSFNNISAGYMHSCAIGAGSLWCWGLGQQGQLGVGLRTISKIPYRTYSPE
ncbi:MAG: hypothetical protein JXR95_06590 [Deltaproteobacteria bacterium]|nr:hypothetical protein [Deltaproteobacteria bacterium]